MSVSPVTANSGTAPGNNMNGLSADALSQQFLNMMVAQMRNQDPTNPMDNNEMVSQLAQFNMASGIASLNQTAQAVGNSEIIMGASDWVGRSVMINGDPSVSLSKDADGHPLAGQSSFGVLNNADADHLTITLTDKNGNVYTQTLDDVKSGVHRYDLNDIKEGFAPALDENGGPFKVKFSALNDNGESPALTALKMAKVQSVTIVNGSAQLDLGVDGMASLSEIYAVE